MHYAPIVLFVYNRPDVTRRTLESLTANEEARLSDLIIFSDGPKENATAQQREAINEVRKLIKSQPWCGSVRIVESPENKGLANSVIDGVTSVVNEYGRLIAIEDDVLISPFFLKFMNEGLAKYENEDRVLSLGSWNYYYEHSPNDTFFIHLPDTIAWASWKRAWDRFDKDAERLYKNLQDRNLINDFNLGGRFPYEAMLKQQLAGKVSSWAIRFTAHALLNNLLTLYPAISMSKHIGFGADSTHVKSPDYNADLELAHRPIMLENISLQDDQKAIDAFIHFETVTRPLRTSRKRKFLHLAKKIIKPVWWKTR